MSDPIVDPVLPSCQQMMEGAVAAYLRVMTGPVGQVAKVKFGDHETEYTRRNADDLLTMIRNLHMQCPCSQSAALLGIPTSRAPGRPVYVDRGWEGAFPIRRRW